MGRLVWQVHNKLSNFNEGDVDVGFVGVRKTFEEMGVGYSLVNARFWLSRTLILSVLAKVYMI